MNITFKDIDLTNKIHTDTILKLAKSNDFYCQDITFGLNTDIFKFWNYKGMFLLDSLKVIGFIIFTTYNLFDTRGCKIQFLLIDKLYQNKKIGTLVVNKFKNDFIFCGAVVKKNEYLFWQKFNFIKVSEKDFVIYSSDSEFLKNITILNEFKTLLPGVNEGKKMKT